MVFLLLLPGLCPSPLSLGGTDHVCVCAGIYIALTVYFFQSYVVSFAPLPTPRARVLTALSRTTDVIDSGICIAGLDRPWLYTFIVMDTVINVFCLSPPWLGNGTAPNTPIVVLDDAFPDSALPCVLPPRVLSS